MSKLIRKSTLVVIGLFALTLASSASADLKNYTATLELDILGLNTASGLAEGVTDVAPDGSFALPAGIFLLDTVPSSTPAPGIGFFSMTASNFAGMFLPSGPDFGGLMPLTGGAYFSLLTGKTLSVPLGVIGGSPASTVVSGAGGAVATLAGGPWTLGTDARTANGSGMIQLVTPILFVISGTAIDGSYGTFGVLTVDFAPVPEPGTSVLLASGLAGLAFLGRKQRARA